MKKEDVTALIVYLFIVAVAVIFGLTVLQNASKEIGIYSGAYVGFVVGAVLAGVVFNALVFELAHILGAKAGRYDILLINILGLCFYKKDGKTAFKFSGFNGLTGETKIAPKKDAKKEPNPRPYLLFGALFYAIEVIAVIIIFTFLYNTNISTVKAAVPGADYDSALGALRAAYFILVVMFVGGMIFIYNILPFKLDSITDGYRLTLVSNPKNKVAFNELLRVETAIENGETDVEIKTFDVITNFTADLNLNKVYVMLDNGEYQEAIPLIQQIIDAKKDVSENVYFRALAQLIFIYFMTLSYEDAVAKIEAEIPVQNRREISQDNSMVSARAYILLAGLMDRSKSEVLRTINNIQKSFKSTPKARRPIEVKLFNLALSKVEETNPKWDLAEYHLKEIEGKPKNK